MAILILYFSTAAIFLLADAFWLRTVMGPLFERHLGDMLRPSPAIGIAAAFYLVYVVGLLWFASYEGLSQKSMGRVALDAGLFGFFAYGTYELTNYSTLNRWSWEMVLADMAWGTVLSAGSAVVGLAVARAFAGS